MFQIKVLLIVILTSLPAFCKTPSADKNPVANPNEEILELSVTDSGYQPNLIHADPDKFIILKVTRKTKEFCVKSLEILTLNIHRKLPLNKPVLIKLGKVEPGEIKLDCVPGLKESGLIYVK